MPEIEEQLREQVKFLERKHNQAMSLLREASALIHEGEESGALWHDKYGAFLFPAHDCAKCGRIQAGNIDPCDIPY